uniref:Uncharacterized protein n=2 Tax=Photinus pyralis TaxID=7054 RepID=A0A1Y1MDN4_PHOPY
MCLTASHIPIGSSVALGAKRKLRQRIEELERKFARPCSSRSSSRTTKRSGLRRRRGRGSRSSSRFSSARTSHSRDSCRSRSSLRGPACIETTRRRNCSVSRDLPGASTVTPRDVYSPSGLASSKNNSPPFTAVYSPCGLASVTRSPPEPGEDDVLSLHGDCDLSDDIVQILGGAPENTNTGSKLHEKLSAIWQTILQNGLGSEEFSQLLGKHIKPSNCEKLTPPEINQLVAQVMTSGHKNRDLTLSSSQNQITDALSALGQAITRILVSHNTELSPELKDNLLHFLGDTGRLLTNLFFSLTKLRRSLIFPLVNKEVKAVLEKTSPTEHLFGDGLSEKIRDAKALQSASSGIKATYSTSFKKPTPKRGGSNSTPHTKALNRQRPVRRGETRQYKGQIPKSYNFKETRYHRK